MTATSARRREGLALAIFAAAVFASLAILVHPWFDPVRDASTYIALARSLASGEGYRFLGEPMVLRPPGFALAILPVVALRGVDFLALNLLVAAFGALGVVLLGLYTRPRLGLWLALLVSLAVWLNPGYQRLATQIMSDVPGTTLVLACLLVERWASRAPSWRRELCLVLAIAAAASVRSQALLLVPAILLARLLPPRLASRRRFAPTRLAPVALGVALVVLPWSLRNALVAPPPPADQLDLYSYTTGMWHADRGDPRSPRIGLGEVLERVPLRLRQTADGLGDRIRVIQRGNAPPRAAPPAGHAAFAFLLLAGLVVSALRHREPGELFALAAIALGLIYFGFNTRLLLPVYVLALPAGVELLRDALARAAGSRGASLLTGALLVLLIAMDFAPRRDWREIGAHHNELADRVIAIDAAVAPDARIGADLGFYYGLYLGRPVYSLSMAIRRAGRVEAADAIIEAHDLDTVVLTRATPAERQLGRYLTSRYGKPRAAGSASVWQVGPSPGR